MALPTLYTKRQIADTLHVSVRQVDNYILSGKLSYSYKNKGKGGSVFFTEEDIQKYLDSIKVPEELKN